MRHMIDPSETDPRRARFLAMMAACAAAGSVRGMSAYTQHGDTSTLLHCLAVAYYSCVLARALRLKVRENELVRGAMLHDYFLYDWHVKSPASLHHATGHARKAMLNAQRDFQIGALEKDIILKHMFPLSPGFPRHRESWLVTAADKGCSLYETLCRGTYPFLRKRFAAIL